MRQIYKKNNTMAKTIDKRIYIWLNQQGIEDNLKSIKAAINKTANELNKLPVGTEEWYRKSEKLQKLKGIFSFYAAKIRII